MVTKPQADPSVTTLPLARNLAAQGAKSRLLGLVPPPRFCGSECNEGVQETWREWGRSLDLKDASNQAQLWGDVTFLVLVQALPWLLAPALGGLRVFTSGDWPLTLQILWGGVNIGLVALRLGMQTAVASAYCFDGARGRWAFWLSPASRCSGGYADWVICIANSNSMAGSAIFELGPVLTGML